MKFALIYIVCLPISVWWWANVFSVVDETQRVKPLLRLLSSTCILLAALLLIGREHIIPLFYAILTILFAYVLTFYLARQFALGVRQYTDRPIFESTYEDQEDPEDLHEYDNMQESER